MAYKCYYRVTSSSASDWLTKLFGYIEAMGWVKEKGLEVADCAAFVKAHAYVLGDMVKPTTLNGLVYICSTAGTSHATTEPTWSTTIKAETVSSTAKFRGYRYGRVYSSQGEAGTEPKNYFYLYQDNGVTAYCIPLGVIGIAQWKDATWLCIATNAGLANGVSANPCYTYIYGNKDFVVVCTAYGGSYYYSGFGFFVPVWTLRTTMTSAVTAGAHANLEVASSAGVFVGQWLQMWGANEEGRDKVIVEAVPDAAHITVVNLPRDYSSGSLIGISPVRTFFQNAQAVAMADAFTYMALGLAGTASNTTSYTHFCIYLQLQTGSGPDYRVQKNLLRPASYYDQEDYNGGNTMPSLSGYLPTDVILQQFRACTSLDLFLVYDGYTYPVSGTASSGGSTTLTDTGKGMTPDAWVGKILVITAGIGTGQTRQIISNTEDTFTVNAWSELPDGSSSYCVVDEAWRALGNGSANCPVVKEIL